MSGLQLNGIYICPTLADYGPDVDPNSVVVDGAYYADFTSFIQTGILQMCGCGNPDENLAFLLEALEIIDMPRPVPQGLGDPALSQFYAEKTRRSQALFGAEVSGQFFGYWLDSVHLTEHGFSIGGAWLTDKGKALLSLLREWKVWHDDLVGDESIHLAQNGGDL